MARRLVAWVFLPIRAPIGKPRVGGNCFFLFCLFFWILLLTRNILVESQTRLLFPPSAPAEIHHSWMQMQQLPARALSPQGSELQNGRRRQGKTERKNDNRRAGRAVESATILPSISCLAAGPSQAETGNAGDRANVVISI